MGKKAKIFFVIFIVLELLFATLFQLPFCFVKVVNAESFTNNNILKTCFESNGNVPITKIALLGSHDALTNNINISSKSNINEDNIANNKFVNNFAKGMVVRLSKAQAHNVYAQLNAGVRFIDARITKIDNVFYTSHGLLSSPLAESIEQIIQFLDENAGEFVVFQITKLYPETASTHHLPEFINTIKYNNKSLYDFVNYNPSITNPAEITYNSATLNGTKGGIILIPPNTLQRNLFKNHLQYGNYFKISSIKSYWHNSISNSVIIEKTQTLFNTLQLNPQTNNNFVVNQFQTTPNFNNPFKTLFSWGLLQNANRFNLKNTLNPNFNTWLTQMPIVLFDFTTNQPFNSTLISTLNTFNQTL